MQPYDRQPFDTDESFLWFQAYRDAQPPRALDRVRSAVPGKIKPPLQNLLTWYQEHFWKERAISWDEHLDKIRQEEKEAMVGQDARSVAAQHHQLVKEATELVSRELDKMLRTSMSADAETLKPGELNRMMENVIKLNRLMRGEATDNVAHDIDLSGLPLEDLRKLQELKQKVKK